MGKIATKDTQRLKHIPSHARPEEFLTDADLASLYEREIADPATSDKARADLARKLRKARVAAALTEQVQDQALEDAEAATKQRAKDDKDRADLFSKLVSGKALTEAEQKRAEALLEEG